ncbi:MAG: NrfD/PsrC family molybdoenzyme membrane anchor subunit, partial [Candidatus Methylomirabilales bacterium]
MMTFLKSPHWEWYIVWYFFLGGIAGGAYFVGAIADNFGGKRDEEVAKSGYLLALPLTMMCGALLTLDLGMPFRFLNMLRQFKAWNPMSVGSWGIGAFGAFAFASAALSFARDARLVWLRKNIGKVGSLFGFFLASYTGVLLASTARPVWTDARFMGALFLASGASTGIAAIGLLSYLRGAELGESWKKVKKADSFAMVVELVLLGLFLGTLGPAGRAIWAGPFAVLFWFGLIGIGLVVPLALSLTVKPRPGQAGLMTALASTLI